LFAIYFWAASGIFSQVSLVKISVELMGTKVSEIYITSSPIFLFIFLDLLKTTILALDIISSYFFQLVRPQYLSSPIIKYS